MKKACEKWVTACLSCQQVKDPRKLRFPLQSIESSEFNEVEQIDHQKICMTDSFQIILLSFPNHTAIVSKSTDILLSFPNHLLRCGRSFRLV